MIYYSIMQQFAPVCNNVLPIRDTNAPSCRTGNGYTFISQLCSQYPQIRCLACCRLFFSLNSGLSKYYKPVHLSPLAFILLLLEFFLFGIALSFGGGFSRFLIDDPLPNEWHNRRPAHTGTQIPSGRIMMASHLRGVTKICADTHADCLPMCVNI